MDCEIDASDCLHTSLTALPLSIGEEERPTFLSSSLSLHSLIQLHSVGFRLQVLSFFETSFETDFDDKAAAIK